MKSSLCNIILCIFAAVFVGLMASCAAGSTSTAQSGSDAEKTTDGSTTYTTASATAPKTTVPKTTVSTTSPATSSTTSAVTTAATAAATVPETTAAPTAAPVQQTKPWKETACNEQLYVNTYCVSRARAEIGAAAVNQYYTNQKLNVVAVTDTGYYKLDNGEYIHQEYLSGGYYVTFNTTSSKYEAAPIPKQPPANTDKTCEYYNPEKALAFAAANWDSGMGHCAAFGEACIAAGGIHGLTDLGATPLYNQLLASGLGFAVEIGRDEEGYIKVPDYAFPGDIMLFYCPKEKCMVHTLVYNGCTKDGRAKAYAHNLANDGQEALWYFSFCPDGCGADIDNLALFCWYRNPEIMKQPDEPPVLNVKTKDSKAYFNWTADFLYSDSALVVKDKNGKEVYRRSMGTDKQQSLTFYSTEKYTAYIEMYIGKDITVKSAETAFSVPKAAKK